MIRLGISSCFLHAHPTRPIFKGKTLLHLEPALLHWVQSEGVVVSLAPTLRARSPFGITDIVKHLDGLVLQGGSDVSPTTYGESPLRPEWSGDAVRDQYEIQLVRECMAQNKPVLGVCRGEQLLNVAFGGTLFQDIKEQNPAALVHRDWVPYDQIFHEIVFEDGSLIKKLYPDVERARVNTVHHQA